MWTDSLLKYVCRMTKPKPDAFERWVAKLALFDFDILHIPGPKNVVADAPIHPLHWYQSKARIIDLRRCPSVLRMGGETDLDGFGRTFFDLYFSDGCGC